MSAAIDPAVFKAYDIRGTYPDQIDETTALAIGRAFALVRAAEKQVESAAGLRIAIGHDMRHHSAPLAEAFCEGLIAEGAHVIDIGMVGTEIVYYAVGSRELDGGASVTASHNPKQWAGFKLLREGAIALSGERGIGEIRALIEQGMPGSAAARGAYERVDVYDQFRAHVLSFIDPDALRSLKVVLDGGNGMAGPMIGPLLDSFPLDQERLYFEPNGEFPGHEPNPLLPENRKLIIDKVLESGAELGIAWDGDADRCFFIDDTGEFVPGDFLTALLAQSILERNPGSTILYDLRASRAVPDTVATAGGRALVNRVGHAFFKTRMREEDAAFAGEVSGHYYFRDFWYADSGTVPALLILELLSKRGKRMSELLAPFRARYFISGEINSEVGDQQARMAEIAERYSDGEVSRLDGISVDYETWHFNVRPSNTEPLLRLNLEGSSQQEMERRRDELLALIRQ
ncbi:MAG: phosphomannomutase/phosphoglucomutase [Solirubrobacterales bacterium]